jgi:hypothetical protein
MNKTNLQPQLLEILHTGPLNNLWGETMFQCTTILLSDMSLNKFCGSEIQDGHQFWTYELTEPYLKMF